MAERGDENPTSDDDYEDSRYYGNEGDGVMYATVDELHGIQPSESVVEEPATPQVLSEKERKKEEKRRAKEAKAREKREKELLKEQEKEIKDEAKRMQSSGSMKKKDDSKATNRLSSVVSPQRPGIRPKQEVECRVRLLDGTDYVFKIQKSATGQLLVDMVLEYVNLLEREYFSCYFIRDEVQFWLISDRRVAKQLGKLPWHFEFGVKYYPPEPSRIIEDITRYELCLQVRNDIASGKLPSTLVTHAILGAFTVQAELGDYDVAEHGPGSDYLHEFNFCPGPTQELLDKIAQIHRTLRGQSPAEAELNYLDNAKKLELYGVHLQTSKDAELVNIMIGVSALGLVVYRGHIRANRFPWPLVLKMAYKTDKFYLKIRPRECEQYTTTIAFKMGSHDLAKRFWRLCIDHHSFFRLKQPMMENRSVFSRFGTMRHRFTGRTLYQSQTWASSVQRVAPEFERSSSRMMTSRSLGTMSASYVMNESRRRTLEDFESADTRPREQISVVAGTGPEASRLAFVKTVRPGDPTHDPQGGTSVDSTYRYRQHLSRDETEVVVHAPAGHVVSDTSFSPSAHEGSFHFQQRQQQLLSPDSSFQQQPPSPKKKKKKGSSTAQQPSISNDNGNFTENYKAETNGVSDASRIERRQHAGREEMDSDMELSRAINSVIDVQSDVSVDRIEINPKDVAFAMAGAGANAKIEVVPGKAKKTKKSKMSKQEVIAE